MAPSWAATPGDRLQGARRWLSQGCHFLLVCCLQASRCNRSKKKLEGKNLKLDTFLPLAVAAVPCNHSPTPNNLGGKNPKCCVWIFVEGSLGPGPGIPVFKGTGSLGVSPCPGIPPWIWGSPRHSAFPPGPSFVPCFLGHVIILMIVPI